MKKNLCWYESIIYLLVIISLLFSFTNYLYFSAISSLSILFVVVVYDHKKIKVSKLTIVLFLFFIYCFISAMIVNPKQLLDFQFYRHDGNLFITFAPLLILSMCHIKFNVWKIIKYFVSISTVFNTICIVLFLIRRTNPEYSFMFYAHNAAGGFLSILVIANLFLFFKIKKNERFIYFIFFVINIIGLVLTNSRGSIIPLFAAFFIYYLMRKTKSFKEKGKSNLFFNFLDIIAFSCVLLGFLTISMYISTVRSNDVLTNWDAYVLPNEFVGSKFSSILGIFNRSWTMINRLYYLWPKAMALFSKSPIFGTGFGSFNDNSLSFSGISGIISFSNSDIYLNGSNHAHNSYLHFLAEIGIIGFVLFMILLYEIRKDILKILSNMNHTCRTTNSTLYYSLIGVLLALHLQGRIYG